VTETEREPFKHHRQNAHQIMPVCGSAAPIWGLVFCVVKIYVWKLDLLSCRWKGHCHYNRLLKLRFYGSVYTYLLMTVTALLWLFKWYLWLYWIRCWLSSWL